MRTTSSQFLRESGVLTSLLPDGPPWVTQERLLEQRWPPLSCSWWWAPPRHTLPLCWVLRAVGTGAHAILTTRD